ncbi:uncharacterized protein IL334_003826 [Kwoniella shivajii]|uniref:Citrate transporter-like domain-containing protein n=1 Tax=Kwoniella shivajii TaxID=564305 RepID=A0ABZ1CYM5_9TREE|nr:hypothetical protein IL334_003826 [Kwoniella shivajii]
MAVTPLTDGSDRSIDARSIVTLIIFFVVNALVIWPFSIPLPLILSRSFDNLLKRTSSELPSKREGVISSDSSSPAPTPSPLARNSENDTRIPEDNICPAPVTNTGENDTFSLRSKYRFKRLYFPVDLRTAPVIGVLILLASTCIPGPVVKRGIIGSGGVKPYDVLTLFICFAYISISLDTTGLLRYLAFLVASKSTSHGGGITLYNSFYLLFALIGLFFGNDPLILSGTPFLAYFTDHASINPSTSFIFTHFQVANLVSALLVSSNITNLVLTSAFGISFLSYSAWLALPTIASVIVLYPILRWVVFRQKGLIPKTIHPPTINPKDALLDPSGAIIGATIFIITVIALVALSAVKLLEGTEGVWTVTLPAAIIVLIRDIIRDWVNHKDSVSLQIKENKKHDEKFPERRSFIGHSQLAIPARPESDEHPPTSFQQTTLAPGKRNHVKPVGPLFSLTSRFPTVWSIICRLPIALLPFSFSFFILVEGLQHTGWIRVFGNWWGAWEEVAGVAGSVWLMGVLSVIGCNIFGTNIGATILLARVLQYWATTRTVSDRSLYGAVFTLAVGSNFGAYSFVFSASLAGLLWRSILSQKGIVITLREFMKWNLLPMMITMLVGCLIVAGEVCVIYKS